MKPRILFVDHVGVLGGAELSLLDIARYFKESSRVVLFEDGPFRERLEQAGVHVHVLPAPGAVARVAREGGLTADLRAAPGVLRLAGRLARRARGFDVLYANSQKSMIVAAVAGLLARRPVVWHLRDLMTADHFSRGHRWVTTCVANTLVARVIANSQATCRAFVESGGRAERVATVHNGIDPAPFDAVDGDDVERLRKEWAPEGAPLIGVFSRLAPWKGQHVLIEALRHVPPASAGAGSAHVLLVGDALFGEEARYAEALRRQVRRLGLAGRVHFLGFRDDVPQLMRAVDVVAHTSTAPEPFGRVIVEGMLAGRPVVATKAGGALEVVEDGATGLLVPPDAPHVLGEALQQLLTCPDLAARLARDGRAAARRRFSMQQMLGGVAQQIHHVLLQ